MANVLRSHRAGAEAAPEPGMTVGDDGRGSPARVIEPFQCASLS